MKRMLFLLLLVPVLSLAQSPFDGTWKFEPDQSKLPTKADEYLLKDGMYECKTCKPAIKVKADGQFHKVTGQPRFDMQKVSVIDDRHINTEEHKGDKPMGEGKWSVSDDGSTLTIAWTDYSNPAGGPVSGTSSFTRVGTAPAGANAVSGSWREAKLDIATSDALLFTYKTAGDSFSMTTPTGQSYNAKLDGRQVPYVGDPATTTVSLKRIGDAIEETDYRDGKVIAVAKSTVSADGKTMTTVVDDRLHGTTGTYVSVKQ